MADETPPPTPPFAACCITITKGKASDTPASASAPSLPRNNPSKVIMPAIARRFRTFGAESRSSVESTGPSSSSLVRPAIGRLGADAFVAVGGNDDWEMAMLGSVISAPPARVGAALETMRLQEIGWLRLDPMALRMAKSGYVYLP